MAFTATPGETLLLPVPNAENKHLFIIVAGTEPHTNNVIIVGLETREKGCDTTLILRKGDHPFVKHETSVRYKGARIISADTLIQYVNHKMASPNEACSPELLEKIRQGLRRSPFVSYEVIDLYNKLTWP